MDWFKSVDATYRAELRESNDCNFAHFEAKLEQRLAELEARLKSELGGRITALEARIEVGLADVRRDLTTRIAGRNFAFWVTTLLAILGSRLL